MRPHLGAFFEHRDGNGGIPLFQADRGGKPGRPGADDDDVEGHRLAGLVARFGEGHWR